jgi:serine/threonine protein kinase
MSTTPDDDDRTVIRPPSPAQPSRPTAPGNFEPTAFAAPASAAPPPAGPSSAASSAGDSGNALPVGTYISEFEVTSVLGEGGFGIVYLAWDHSLERRVALKEYMPAALAARSGATQVQVKSARHQDTFDLGRKSFVNEAKLLAQFDHPSLVKVYRFWEANGTAYMVMPFYEGITLKDKLRAMGAPPDEEWLMGLLAPLTEALAVVHAESCYHRDIAPDNVILLNATGKPLLLDFGAARRVIGDMTQALTVILKPGYAPIEQYAEAPGMKQGPWTDVYALAASVHFAILGKTPPASVGRLMGDNFVPMAQSAAGRYSPRFLESMDRALKVRPEERTQTIADLRADLGLGGGAADSHATVLNPKVPAFDGSPSVSSSSFDPLASAAPAAARPAARTADAAAAPAAARAPAAAAASSGKGLWIGIGAAVLVAAGIGGFMLMSSGPETSPPVATAPATSPATAPVATPAPAPARVAVAPQPVAPPPPAAPARFDTLEQFDKVLAGQTPGFTVEAVSARPQLRIGRDKLSFTVKSSRDGYVNVLLLGPDGSLLHFFPNSVATDNRIQAGQTLTLPQKNWILDTSEPAGAEHFLVFVSQYPRDFSVLSKQREFYFLELPTGETATALMAGWKYPTPMLLGAPSPKGDCQGPACDVYGATRFTVDVVN